MPQLPPPQGDRCTAAVVENDARVDPADDDVGDGEGIGFAWAGGTWKIADRARSIREAALRDAGRLRAEAECVEGRADEVGEGEAGSAAAQFEIEVIGSRGAVGEEFLEASGGDE